MKTFSHPPTVAVCTREREGWVGDGPKGSYLSNFRRLQKEQPRDAPPPRHLLSSGAGRKGIGRGRGHTSICSENLVSKKLTFRTAMRKFPLFRKHRQPFGIWPDRGRGKGEKDATPPLRALPRSKDLARQSGSAPPAVFSRAVSASSRR